MEKRGFTCLYGVASLTGYYNGKMVDIVVKSANCKQCEVWNKKMYTEEYKEGYESHIESCCANHSGSSEKMEVDAIIEMFKRSIEKYGVMYKNYIGDGDSKTYPGILKALPYGIIEIINKECIGHVRKRMGTRLREIVKKLLKPSIKPEKKFRKKFLLAKENLRV